MIVRILSCGVNWWGMHAKDLSDPLCFSRKTAYFNSTGLMFGRRLRHLFLYRGRIRFNRTSGFDPEFVERIAGKTFHSPGPIVYGGSRILLFDLPAKGQEPDACLVTFNNTEHGAIDFRAKSWRSAGIDVIAVSRFRERYQAMLLLRPDQWVRTSFGFWQISGMTHQLTLQEAEPCDTEKVASQSTTRAIFPSCFLSVIQER